jgi:hemolysin-activating ACP:hemolysin acyltransferase
VETDAPTLPVLRLFRPDKPAVALGLSVSYLMGKPAFANLKFGDWSSILVGQVNRKHYAFVLDAQNKIRGFAGWALTTQALAEAWVEGNRPLSYQESLAGDCLVFNAWAAESPEVHRFMVDETRRMGLNLKALYFKRHYRDGRFRPVRLPANEFVASHVARAAPEQIS